MKTPKHSKSNGIRGWLLFFAIIAGLAGTTRLFELPSVILEGNIKTILHVSLLVFIAFLTVALILLRKRAAKYAYIVFIIIFPVGSLLVRLLQLKEPIEELIGSIALVTAVIILVSGYFLRSKRVQNTLVK